MIALFLFLLSVITSATLVWYKLSLGILLLDILGAVLTTLLLFRWYRPATVVECEQTQGLLEKRLVFIILFSLLSIAAVILLALHQSTGVLQTPWQSISIWYLPVFFLLTLVVSVLLWSNYHTKTLLGALLIFSLIQHLYLPLAHVLPWGGDVWRHIAVEQRLMNGEFYPPVLFGPEAKFNLITLSPNHVITVPEVFLIPQKYSYGQLWGITVLVTKFTWLSLETVNIWLISILWSLTIPLLLFRIGTLLFQSRRAGLWLAFLVALPFPFQALGGLTLPNSLGYITFFYVLMMWLEYLHNEKNAQRNLTFVLAALMIFGYTLHFILIWAVIIATYSIKWISRLHNQLLKRSLATVGFFASLFVIPVIELVAKISYAPENFNLILNLKRLVGQFSGWYFASSIRPTDTLSGNFIFNHTPLYAFVTSFFTEWRWWVVPVMLLVWLAVFVGVTRLITHIVSTMELVMGVLLTTTFGSYIIGWYVLDGDRLFTRRLDGMMAFLVMVFFIYGLRQLNSWQKAKNKKQLFIVHCSLLIVFAFFTAATYASGPDLRVVSQDEYLAAKYVWEHVDHEATKDCVLADTWTLLPLEALSSGKIVGGGFPIDYQFAQPERTLLFSELVRDPRVSIMTLAKEKTGASGCYAIVPKAVYDGQQEKYQVLFGHEPTVIGDQAVFVYDK